MPSSARAKFCSLASLFVGMSNNWRVISKGSLLLRATVELSLQVTTDWEIFPIFAGERLSQLRTYR